jgi:hypothetical protein
MPLSPIEFVAVTCHWNKTLAPLSSPAAAPTPFGPRHVPLNASPDCRSVHTGLTWAIDVVVVIVPLTLQVPEKLAASAGRAGTANSANPANAEAKQAFAIAFTAFYLLGRAVALYGSLAVMSRRRRNDLVRSLRGETALGNGGNPYL